ncbi:DUF6527 family protein [Nonlabens xiamenensis]|uniref:DUF6527 family protein n=1 Tax=Nonlabens xiamenensis TaxID=2341043 RepID=UPI000F614418|nr:DUF6527 family protein [Nonlabens xiamenensis]
MFRLLKTLIGLFFSWISSFGYKGKPDTKEIVDNGYQLLSSNEIPLDIDPKIIYVEGNSKILGNNWYAHFICPCGCEERIMLNLLEDVSPSWSLTINKDKTSFSIYPSIWRTNNCKSHFWIKDGKVLWV